jgi:molecular chaperone DnaK
LIANLFLAEIRTQYGLDLSTYPDHMQAVRLEAERAKIRLSEELKTDRESRPPGK